MEKIQQVAIILVESGVQDQEFWYPFYRLQEAGFKVVVSGPSRPKDPFFKAGVSITSFHKNQPTGPGILGKYGIPIQCDIEHSQLRSESPQADVVIIPGGWECPEKLRMNQDVLDYVMQQYQAGAVIGAICHGPWVLISAGLADGKQMTCYKGMKDDLVNAGAVYVESEAQYHDGIVTSPHYRNNPQFMGMVLAAVNSKWRRVATRKSRPTVVELDEILNSGDRRGCQILPDGSVVDLPTLDQTDDKRPV